MQLIWGKKMALGVFGPPRIAPSRANKHLWSSDPSEADEGFQVVAKDAEGGYKSHDGCR